ncbi:MAG: tol-pal system protein YbgF [Gammaproteobacteria bacterium]|nr:tol-pal system protein YbgF [Gammaproteobacteria bacterium]MDD9850515.1 tol-pal system protein YbgF [Gammaproteobacteria bacterium]
MFTARKLHAATAAALLALSAPAPAAAQVDDDRLLALTRVEELQKEVRELTNRVETLEYELGRERKRRDELYRDMQARIDELERQLGAAAAVAAAGESPDDAGGVENDGAAAVAVNGESQDGDAGVENGETEAATADPESQTAAAIPPDPAEVQARYDEAFEFLKRSHYSRAVTAFRDFLGEYPATELSDDAAYWIAEAHYVTRSFADALQGFQLMRRRYPDSVRVPDATLKVGYIQYEIGAYTDARATFTAITTDYPGSRVAISAKTRLQKMDRQGL